MIKLTPIRTAAAGLLALATLMLVGGAVDTALAPPVGATNATVALLKPVCAPNGQYIVTGSITNQWEWPLLVYIDHGTGNPIGYDNIAPATTQPVSFTMPANSSFTWSATGYFKVGPQGNQQSVAAHITGGPWKLETGDPCTAPPTAPTPTSTCPPGTHDDAPVSPCANDVTTTTAVEIATPTTIPVETSSTVTTGVPPASTVVQRQAPPRTPVTTVASGLPVTGPSAAAVAPYAAVAVAIGALLLLALRIDRHRRAKREQLDGEHEDTFV